MKVEKLDLINTEKVCRKKEYGGKYNEKFLDYGNQMPAETDEESEE